MLSGQRKKGEYRKKKERKKGSGDIEADTQKKGDYIDMERRKRREGETKIMPTSLVPSLQ